MIEASDAMQTLVLDLETSMRGHSLASAQTALSGSAAQQIAVLKPAGLWSLMQPIFRGERI